MYEENIAFVSVSSTSVGGDVDPSALPRLCVTEL